MFSKSSVEVRYNCAMPNHKLPEPILVKKSADLERLTQKLSKQPLIAVDTEANSLYAYQERVCLIQFSIPGFDYLLDPLSVQDLSPLSPIFKNPKIEKIFHAAEYDLILLKHDFGFYFNGIFDTMLAARILGWKSLGLSSILKTQFDVDVNKKYQRANWGRRPLPREMLTYAQLDTHYLIPIRNQLKSELRAKGRWELASEDFLRITRVNPTDHQRKNNTCWRIHGVRDLIPKQISVLQELCKFRDKFAKSLDRPLFKVINDKTLLNIAVTCPKSLDELEQVTGVSKKQVNWFGDEILRAIKDGKKKAPPKLPQKPRLSDRHLARIDALRGWRKLTARKMRVESDVILPKDLLNELAEKNPKTQKEFNRIMKSIPWRLDRFGQEIFDLLKTSN